MFIPIQIKITYRIVKNYAEPIFFKILRKINLPCPKSGHQKNNTYVKTLGRARHYDVLQSGGGAVPYGFPFMAQPRKLLIFY